MKFFILFITSLIFSMTVLGGEKVKKPETEAEMRANFERDVQYIMNQQVIWMKEYVEPSVDLRNMENGSVCSPRELISIRRLAELQKSTQIALAKNYIQSNGFSKNFEANADRLLEWLTQRKENLSKAQTHFSNKRYLGSLSGVLSDEAIIKNYREASFLEAVLASKPAYASKARLFKNETLEVYAKTHCLAVAEDQSQGCTDKKKAMMSREIKEASSAGAHSGKYCLDYRQHKLDKILKSSESIVAESMRSKESESGLR